MKNVMKTATLESKFPLLAVENGCIISKDADTPWHTGWNCRNCSR